MKISKRGIALISEFEGLRLKAYRDAVGVPTIGYGTTRIDGKPVSLGTEITKDQAIQYLADDADRFAAAVERLVTVPLNQNEFDALVSFTYNLGETNLASSTLLKRLNAGDRKGAADEFLRWVYAGREKLLGLERRRTAERKLFLAPVEQTSEPTQLDRIEQKLDLLISAAS